jgi:hypothetical protein
LNINTPVSSVLHVAHTVHAHIARTILQEPFRPLSGKITPPA